MASIVPKYGFNISTGCSGIIFVGCTSTGNSIANITGGGYTDGSARVLSCNGMADSAVVSGGSTAQRPTNPISGQQYYDATLGLPIWYNTVSSSWKRADGTSV